VDVGHRPNHVKSFVSFILLFRILFLLGLRFLSEATDGFKEELGKGAFGVVYKGVIQTGSTVLAVNETGGHGFFFQSCSCGQPVLVLFPTSQSRLEHFDQTLPPLEQVDLHFRHLRLHSPRVRGGEPSVLETESYRCRIFLEVQAWAAMF